MQSRHQLPRPALGQGRLQRRERLPDGPDRERQQVGPERRDGPEPEVPDEILAVAMRDLQQRARLVQDGQGLGDDRLAPAGHGDPAGGAGTVKLRVYEMTKNSAARQMLGYLFTRGGVHAHAYALALEKLTGVDLKKMLPIPNIEGVEIPESGPFIAEGLHRRLYRFSPEDYCEIATIWQGDALDGSGPLEVIDGPQTGGTRYEAEAITSAFISDHHPKQILVIAQKLYAKAS
jgi:hypothetical protein